MSSVAALRAISRTVQRPSFLTAVTRSYCLGRSFPLLSARRFTTANKHDVSTSKSELVEALKCEIEAENKLATENLVGKRSPSISDFKMTTNEAEVRLTKTYGNEKILVVFNVNHSVDVEEDAEGESDEASIPVPVALPPFTIEITKENERLCFNMELVESPDEQGQYDFRVEEFYVAPAVVGDNEDVAASVYASSGKYIDPNLHELLFLRYLEERGFDGKFCEDLVNFATHYEHSQYVSLLERIKKFVSK